MATLSGAMFVLIADMSFKEFEVANQMAGFEGSQSESFWQAESLFPFYYIIRL